MRDVIAPEFVRVRIAFPNEAKLQSCAVSQAQGLCVDRPSAAFCAPGGS